MLVSMRKDPFANLPDHVRGEIDAFSKSPLANLTPGRIYVVYAISALGPNRSLRYAVCDDSYRPDDFPIRYPAALFSLVDRTISADWQIDYDIAASGDSDCFTIAFSEWVSDPQFYSRLVEGNKAARATFGKRKREIDSEAASLLDEEDRLGVLFSGHQSDALVADIVRLYPSAKTIIEIYQGCHSFKPSAYVFITTLFTSILDGLEADRESESYREARSLLNYTAGRACGRDDGVKELICCALINSLETVDRQLEDLAGLLDDQLLEEFEVLKHSSI